MGLAVHEEINAWLKNLFSLCSHTSNASGAMVVFACGVVIILDALPSSCLFYRRIPSRLFEKESSQADGGIVSAS